MLREIVHPIHYTFGAITHAPQLFRLWVNEPSMMKASLAAFYLLLFASIGAALSSMNPVVIGFFVMMFAMMMALLTAPQMLCDDRKGDFLFRFSEGFLNSSLVFHGYFMAHTLMVGFFSLVAWQVGMDPLSLIRSIITITTGTATLFAFQMAEARFEHVKPWMVILAAVSVSVLLFYGCTLSMNMAMENLINVGAYQP